MRMQTRVRITYVDLCEPDTHYTYKITYTAINASRIPKREDKTRSKYAIYVPAIVCLACHNLSRIASATLLSAHCVVVPVVSIVAYLPWYYRRHAGERTRGKEQQRENMWGGEIHFYSRSHRYFYRASPIPL